MGNVDLTDLRSWIDELDKLLISGTLQYRAMYGDYTTARKAEGFDLTAYTEVGRKVWVE